MAPEPGSGRRALAVRPRPGGARRGEFLTPSQARRLFAYNERVFERFVRRVRRLPWRQVRRRREIGHQSLFDTLVHILNVHEVWIGYILQRRSGDSELEALFGDTSRRPKDWRGFRTYDRRVWATVRDFLARLSGRDMSRPVRAPWMPGRYVVSDGLWQTSFEQAHHLGEIIGALWQDDLESPAMTWIEIGRGLP
jgi:uncharacterized damage-inducible protein DinB